MTILVQMVQNFQLRIRESSEIMDCNFVAINNGYL